MCRMSVVNGKGNQGDELAKEFVDLFSIKSTVWDLSYFKPCREKAVGTVLAEQVTNYYAYVCIEKVGVKYVI